MVRTSVQYPATDIVSDPSHVPAPHGTRPRRPQGREGSRRRDPSEDSPEGRLPYACPYAKHDPLIYSHSHQSGNSDHDYRNCSTGYWTSIARLKQHLYRTHDKSTRCCQRCWQNLPSDDKYRDHINAGTCRSRPEPQEKMDIDQVEMVKARSQDNEQAWYQIYSILFPNEDKPSSPYAEWITGENLRQCFRGLRKRLPALLWQAAIQFQLLASDEQPNATKLFRTNAQIISQVIDRCQREFAKSTGLEHVFVLPTSPTGSVSSASGGSELGVIPASRIRPNPDPPSQKQGRHSTIPARVPETEEDSSSEDESMDVDYSQQAQGTRHAQVMPHRNRASQAPGTTTSVMPYTSPGAATATFAPSYDDLVAMESIYRTYQSHEDPDYS